MRKETGIRINKYLADNNFCSRREADVLIKETKVFINGKRAKLGDRVFESDEVKVSGMGAKENFYFAYYKKRGVVTINAQDEEKEIKDVAEFPVEGIYPLGRLDKESEGLLIFTNDGRLTDALLNPKKSHEKEYSVKVDKKISNSFIQSMIGGVNIGNAGNIRNYKTKPALVRKTDFDSFDIVLTEGKNRQIRRMCGALGYAVKKLKRFRILNIELRKLKPNTFRQIEGKELDRFLNLLKIN